MKCWRTFVVANILPEAGPDAAFSMFGHEILIYDYIEYYIY
jgi:hypothetical protein